MAGRPQDWIVAASCCEGTRPCVTFADMPREHQRDMFLVLFAAVLSSAYFITLGLLLQPIPSRSLAAPVLLPNAVVSSGAVVAAAIVRSPDPSPRSRHAAQRPLPAIQLASIIELPGGQSRPRAGGAGQQRRRSLAGRWLRGVLRIG